MQEDTYLVQAWLNVSKDAIVGVDQKADSFWLRIKDNYNGYCNDVMTKREATQLKARWHRLNSIVQKFVGCYKQAVNQKKSGSLEKDVMADAHTIFSQDEGEKFKFEHVWRLLKDEPKWTTEALNSSSKRTKVDASGWYTSSSNPETPINCEYDPAVSLECPMGQKAAKWKSKAKAVETSSANIDYSVLSGTLDKKVGVLEKLAQLIEEENKMKQEELKFKALNALLKDTSEMSNQQHRDHQVFCDMLRQKHDMI